MATDDLRAHLLKLQQEQLNAIGRGDYEAYAELCCGRMSCFEPEARGNLVEGLPFHETYFKHRAAGGATALLNTMSRPLVQLLGGEGDAAVGAVISYVRLVQVKDAEGKHATTATQETRVWERRRPGTGAEPWGTWINVHLHRSPA
ncbi:hypothetical protein Rsub_03007 [Raphidocelis subcapitata]|uniref:Calcium/calmodulin-dependent protein kinase II association-domain domain-containing protein n=1 Tax=Raphidocelis subcapitata TaxID=307507 RepID=A0A2V0NSU7_9CHLO|nr:hypothetical protein Rsub_03007 [Raphidocelis subcapitata]|eukprot:GBF90706.1 hypothetical protein Rsub_03007 [Raphidocelis subcapitata]